MKLMKMRGGHLKVLLVVMMATVIFGGFFINRYITHYLPSSLSEEAVWTRGERSRELKENEVKGMNKDGDAGYFSVPKRILAWTTIWNEQSPAWERIFFRQVSGQCPESRCELVHDKRLLESADAVIFHSIDIGSLKSLPKTHPPGQPWVFYSHESPSTLGNRIRLDQMGGIFNWTMTYRQDSDIVAPYSLVLPSVVSPHPVKDYWSDKTEKKMVSWAVSHCITESKREVFVKQLTKYISVDVFGKCGSRKCGKRLTYKAAGTVAQKKCTAEIEKYMFYLAFENSICQDYITEKFFLALTLEIVPVVFGGGNYHDVAPPHSYIDALAFPSPKDLAMYLKRVAKSREEYNSYFAWKQSYTVELGHPFAPLICGLCAKLHDPTSLALPNTTRSLSEHAGEVGKVWGRDGNGSYPDINGWFIRASKCRQWSQEVQDNKQNAP